MIMLFDLFNLCLLAPANPFYGFRKVEKLCRRMINILFLSLQRRKTDGVSRQLDSKNFIKSFHFFKNKNVLWTQYPNSPLQPPK